MSEDRLLKWAPKNIRVGIDSKAAAAKTNLVERQSIIEGHEGSGLFRTGSKGEVVLLQVKLDWNPTSKYWTTRKGKYRKNIYFQYTLATFKGEKIGQSRTVLPTVEKNPSDLNFGGLVVGGGSFPDVW